MIANLPQMIGSIGLLVLCGMVADRLAPHIALYIYATAAAILIDWIWTIKEL